jgi:hypothetical protein
LGIIRGSLKISQGILFSFLDSELRIEKFSLLIGDKNKGWTNRFLGLKVLLNMIKRPSYIEQLSSAARRSPVTTLLGPRQCGKTTTPARIFPEEKGHLFRACPIRLIDKAAYLNNQGAWINRRRWMNWELGKIISSPIGDEKKRKCPLGAGKDPKSDLDKTI